MPNILLLVAITLTVISVLLLILNKKKIVALKSKLIIMFLYAVLIVGIVYIVLTLLGSPLLNKIDAYQQGVLQKSEEECKKDEAPFWCN